jgi:hypothetical protein
MDRVAVWIRPGEAPAFRGVWRTKLADIASNVTRDGLIRVPICLGLVGERRLGDDQERPANYAGV